MSLTLDPDPRHSQKSLVEAGGSIQVKSHLPSAQQITHKGLPTPTKSSGIRCWRDTVLVLSAFDTVCPPLCVSDAPGWQERYGSPVQTSLGTSHGYPAATIPSSKSERPHSINIYMLITTRLKLIHHHGQQGPLNGLRLSQLCIIMKTSTHSE